MLIPVHWNCKYFSRKTSSCPTSPSSAAQSTLIFSKTTSRGKSYVKTVNIFWSDREKFEYSSREQMRRDRNIYAIELIRDRRRAAVSNFSASKKIEKGDETARGWAQFISPNTPPLCISIVPISCAFPYFFFCTRFLFSWSFLERTFALQSTISVIPAFQFSIT